METLFSEAQRERTSKAAPLAVRVRPRTLDEFVGQQQAVGPGTWLRDAIEYDALSSVVLYGPAGTGKTTLARIIAHQTRAEFVEVSAVTGTVADLRREIAAAQQRLLLHDRRTILFVDEIHRFSKSQQDALLHAVENRTVILVGATTENPYFEVNQALISRSRIVELHALTSDDIAAVLDHALAHPEGLAGAFVLSQDAREFICRTSGGDARSALTTLELASQLARRHAATPGAADATGSAPLEIALDDVQEASPAQAQRYDKDGDEHYDTISAFIKSMRGSDPDAAVYWLARMLAGGEDPKFIARRIFILASEDIGNADPQAILVAEAAFRAVEVIGLPECQLNLAQAAIYMALAPKSNASCNALFAAQADVRAHPGRAVPNHLRDRHRPGSESYGPYLYPHDYPGAWVEQQYLPDGLERGSFWRPTERGWEQYRAQATLRRDRDVMLGDEASEG